MKQAFHISGNTVVPTDIDSENVDWINLDRPTNETISLIERRLGSNLPSADRMNEIVSSSRCYHRGDIGFMTAVVPEYSDERVTVSPLAFVISEDQLITLRYGKSYSLSDLFDRTRLDDLDIPTPAGVMIVLIDTILDEIGNFLQATDKDMSEIYSLVFEKTSSDLNNSTVLLKEIGRLESNTSRIIGSLTTLDHMLTYLERFKGKLGEGELFDERVSSLVGDIASLRGFAEFLQNRVEFALDSTLGRINLEQNNIMKIFSVVSIVFLPPTFLASFFGMNFANMSILERPGGYVAGVTAMILSGILPYLFIKYKKWL